MQNSVQLANGVNEIRGALKRLNKRARNATVSFFCVFLQPHIK